ncbi:hypothetical protein B0H13DRAFT_1852110 [Mycena leptocephala]|nr:hypothetical protein B0H13DRAFT_1852088 [Mycena leptocephala]KAJ7937811.1 hypothetical protein B0H13DRAFT_1852110 [Mycena leptocephala]
MVGLEGGREIDSRIVGDETPDDGAVVQRSKERHFIERMERERTNEEHAPVRRPHPPESRSLNTNAQGRGSLRRTSASTMARQACPPSIPASTPTRGLRGISSVSTEPRARTEQDEGTADKTQHCPGVALISPSGACKLRGRVCGTPSLPRHLPGGRMHPHPQRRDTTRSECAARAAGMEGERRGAGVLYQTNGKWEELDVLTD